MKYWFGLESFRDCVFLQWTAAGPRGPSGRPVTVDVGGAFRNEPAAAPIPRLWTGARRVTDRPSKKSPAPPFAQVPIYWT